MQITEKVCGQIRNWSVKFKNNNADALMEAEDFARIAEERWCKKIHLFSPEKGTIEQFTGMVCANTEAELVGKSIEDAKFRRACNTGDRNEGSDDDGQSAAEALADNVSGTRQYWLRFAVRETIATIRNPRYRRALIAALEGYTIREMAAKCHMSVGGYHEKRWRPAVKEFRKLF